MWTCVVEQLYILHKIQYFVMYLYFEIKLYVSLCHICFDNCDFSTETDLIFNFNSLFLFLLCLSECKIENCEACFNRNFCTKCKEGLYSHSGRCYVSCPPDQSAVNETMECVGECPDTFVKWLLEMSGCSLSSVCLVTLLSYTFSSILTIEMQTSCLTVVDSWCLDLCSQLGLMSFLWIQQQEACFQPSCFVLSS